MKSVIIPLLIGIIIGASSTYFLKGRKTFDFSQKLVTELPGNTVIAEYNGGKITADDVQENIKPVFEKTRSELLQKYIHAAEEEFAKRHVNRLEKDAEPVSEAELNNYMRSNKISENRESEIQKFLSLEKKRIQGQLDRIKLLQDLNFKNKLGTAHFDIQSTDGMAEKGASSAKVVVQVFCDFGNPLCNRARLNMEALINQHKESVKWVYRHYPVASNQIGDEASLVSFCALDQDKFWEVHDLFYNQQARLNPGELATLAESAGVDPQKLKTCLQSDKPAKLLKAEKEVAEQLGLNSTPVFFVNGQRISDPEKVSPTVKSLL